MHRMSPVEKRALAVRLYDEWVRRKGGQVFLPHPHRCEENKCKLIEIKGFIPPHFVCEFSRGVHVCGAECDRRDPSGVCVLTGFHNPNPDLQYNPTTSRVNPRVTLNEISVRLPEGRSGKKRRTTTVSPQRRLSQIKTCFEMIMWGKERKDIVRRERDRFNREVCDMIRRRTGGVIPFSETHQAVVEMARKKGMLLNPPAPVLDDTVVTKVCTHIAAYADMFSEVCPELKAACKKPDPFTATMISFFAKGFTLGSVVMITPISFFSKFAPGDIQYGDFPTIKCSEMAKITRLMQFASITKHGHVNMKLKLPAELQDSLRHL